jgi:hypothetical protein
MKKKLIYNDNAIPKGEGVSYPYTPDGYVNMSIKYTPMMGKQAGQKLEEDVQLMKPFSSTGTQPMPKVRSGVIQRPHEEKATYFFSTQKMLPDAKWLSPWDNPSRGDIKNYDNLPPYRKPPHQRKRNPLIAAVPYIPKAQILRDQPATNLFERHDPSQVTLDDLDIDTYGRDRTIDLTKINTMPRERVRFWEARLRGANTKFKKDALLSMIRLGMDYDQEVMPMGITAIPQTYDEPYGVHQTKSYGMGKAKRSRMTRAPQKSPFNVDIRRKDILLREKQNVNVPERNVALGLLGITHKQEGLQQVGNLSSQKLLQFHGTSR